MVRASQISPTPPSYRPFRAYESSAWGDYCRRHGITHEFTAPYSSAQNGLAECAIRTTIDDVRTLLRDSSLGHSYWAEAASYSIDTRNLIPSRCHPGRIPTESFTGKQQSVAHLHVFGAKCWAKIPTAHGGSKLDPRSTECHLLGYVSGSGNYKVQDVTTWHVFVSHDIVFEEGQPCRTLASVGEQPCRTLASVGEQPLFDANTDIVPNTVPTPLTNVEPASAINVPNQITVDPTANQIDQLHIPVEPCQSA